MSDQTPTPTVELTENETHALALRRITQMLFDAHGWLEWEDLPLLDEDGFNRLIDAVQDVRIGLERETATYERAAGVDSREIESRVS